MNYELLKFQILKALRGDKSQLELSNELGFDFNQYHRWESGQKKFLWSDFINLCEHLTIPIIEILRLLNFSSREKETIENLTLKIFTQENIEALGFDISTSTTKRWSDGTNSPDFVLFLNFLDRIDDSLIEFVVHVVDIKHIPLLKNHHNDFLNRIDAYASNPFCLSVQFSLALKQYRSLNKHSDAVLSQITKLSISDVKKALKILEKCKLVEFKDEKYIVLVDGLKIGGIDLVQSAKIGKYITQKSLDRFNTAEGYPVDTGENSNAWAYRVGPLSEEGQRKVKRAIHECCDKVKGVVKEDQTDRVDELTELMAFSIHYFDIGKV